MRPEAAKNLKNGVLIPAMPLVLDQNRMFDSKKQKRLVRYYLEAGAGGIAAAVHTTQFEIRKPEIALLQPVLRTVAEAVAQYEVDTGKAVVKIAGVCGLTEQAVQEAKLAASLGYDAVLLSPGGLNDRTEDYLLERTAAVAEILPVIGFYLQKAVGGREFSYAYWEHFCEIPGVCAIKTAPFDRYMTLDAVRAAARSSRSEEIALYTGNDDNLLFDLLTEFHFQKDGETRTVHFAGGLLGHWSVWVHTAAKYFAEAKKAMESGIIPKSLLTLAAQITDANGALFDVKGNFAGCIVGLHEILRRQGLLDGTWTLNPDEVLGEAQRAELDRVCAMYPELTDDDFVRDFLSRYSD